MAWLHAVPNEHQKSRLEHYKDEDVYASDMPECDAYYVLEHLFQVGLTLGDTAITHGELRAYMENMCIQLQPWELKFMKNLSSAYLNATSEYKNPKSEAPFNAEYFQSADRYIQSMKSKRSIRNILES